MSTTVNGYTYVTTTGVIVPDTGTVLGIVQGEWQSVFGASLNVSSYTVQGVMITAETTARSNVLKNNAAVANQINPNIAGGIFLDAICALTGLVRTTPTYSLVPGVTVAGQPNFTLPAGSLAAEPGGNIYATVAAVDFGPSGTSAVDFQAVTAGPVPAATGTWSINVAVLGWETVSSSNPVEIGATQQSDSSLRTLRNNTLALQGKSSNVAVQSAVNAVPGVVGTKYLENHTASTVTTEGITLVANSFWICVDGGTAAAIAMAILDAKGQGANWNGAQVVPIVSPTSGQTYNVKYDLPTDVTILVQFNVRQGSYVGNPTTDIPLAMVNYASNLVDGFQGLTVGQNASPFDMASAVEEQLPGLRVKSVLVTVASTINYQPTELEAAINQKFVLSGGADGVTVNIVT